MTLAPLLAAPAVIQFHVAAALGALALGAIQLAAPKGTIPHRLFGWLWAALIAGVALSSFFIHTLRVWGPWSPLHLLSIFTLAMLARAVTFARRGDALRHRRAMMFLYGLGIGVSAAFALSPGRLINHVFFGG